MALDLEYRRRIEKWQTYLMKRIYEPVKIVDLQGFKTKKLLPLSELESKPFELMKEGTPWGEKWEYCWFKTAVSLDESMKGKRIVFAGEPGGESSVYINGKNVGAFDHFHKHITLTECAQGNENYEILMECYAGHGPRVFESIPAHPGFETVPEPPENQVTVGRSTVGIWHEDIYQLCLDIRCLYEIRNNMDPTSLRVVKIDKLLKKFTLTIDLEISVEQLNQDCKEFRKTVKPLMEAKNGSSAPAFYSIGNSHIDVAWLWTLDETVRKCSRTFGTMLSLMGEYEDYKFLQSQPVLFQMVKDHYPQLYERMKESIKKGQLIPEGAMYVEPDTNVPWGESLIRQFVHGKRFYKEEFGIDSKLCWLPDVFGYSGALPQILKGCEVEYFSTQKIFWAYNGGMKFPYITFWWEGIDGSKVLSHFHTRYESHANPETVIARWKDREQEEIESRLFAFGYGDGGGGPTRDHLEFIKRQGDLEGSPKCMMRHPVEYFEYLKTSEEGVNHTYKGELYFQAHRGTLTSQAKTKRGNRKSEIALRDAEIYGVFTNILTGNNFDHTTVDAQWKLLLLNQFHDILPGSSIEQVHVEAERDFDRILRETKNITGNLLKMLTDNNENSVTYFNSLSFDVDTIVELPDGFTAVTDQNNIQRTVQKYNDKYYVRVSIPMFGSVSLKKSHRVKESDASEVQRTETYVLENTFVRVLFNEYGEITHVYDKVNDRIVSEGICNQIKMYKDVPTNWDNWDLDSSYKEMPVALGEKATIKYVNGPLFQSLIIERKINQSVYTQEVVLEENSPRIDFHTVVDWRESHKLLKVNFPVNIQTDEALNEIQFGYLKRPNHQSRQYDQDRFEVSNQRWTALTEENYGVAVLNDCKYGVNMEDNSINLTLLKSGLAPDMNADKGIQEFTYSLYFWSGSFMDCDLIKQAYALNSKPAMSLGEKHLDSLIRFQSSNVFLDTVKPAEDGSKDIILRFYEAKKMTSNIKVDLNFDFGSASEVNMLENEKASVETNPQGFSFTIKPFEIKTFKVSMKNKQ
ncbi:MAG TPA: alpha-mannosidase [Clostridiales bacterium]|nr:alpha-mannosidase [Clostridiales bacterium]